MNNLDEEYREIIENIREALDFFISDVATSESVSSQLPGRENGPADAYRHLVWAAEMTRRFGPRMGGGDPRSARTRGCIRRPDRPGPKNGRSEG